MNDLKYNDLNTLTRMKYITTTRPTSAESVLNRPEDTLTNLKEYNTLINRERNIINSKIEDEIEKKVAIKPEIKSEIKLEKI